MSCSKPRSINVWVTLGEDGKVAISFFKPVIEKIYLTDRKGLYPKPGEMIWIFGQCREITELVIGGQLEMNVPVQCTLSIVRKD